ncbi:MAG: protein kinase domain-containing protein, partial [Gemmataceae bacterium]
QPGVMVGTPAFMSPEQARGADVDARSDLFSLGVVLYRLCTGELPFKGTDPMTVVVALAMYDPPAPHAVNPAVPRGLSDLVTRLLRKDPSRRPASAAAVLDELARLQAAEPTVTVPARPPRRRGWRGAAGCVLAAAVLAGVVVLWPTKDGTVRIEINDPDIEVTVGKDGPRVKGAGADLITLAPGPHGLTVRRGDLEFQTKSFTVRKGAVVTLKVELLDGTVRAREGEAVLGERPVPAKSRFPALKPGWLELVGGLPAKARLEAVEEELRRRNPGVVPVSVKPAVIRDGKVVQAWLGKLTDLTPLQGLSDLEELTLADAEALEDLSPLSGLKLTALQIGPEKPVGVSKVTDLSPLAGLPLETLTLYHLPEGADVTPVGAIPTLRTLHIEHAHLTDVRPLRRLRLTRLTLSRMPLTDLSPLAGMPLAMLNVYGSKVASLTPLKGIPLGSLNVGLRPLTKEDEAVIQSLPLHEFHAPGTGLRSLDFLRKLRLATLTVQENPLADLSPLKGMPLEMLWVSNTSVEDLSPLKGMPLTELDLADVPVKDITPLAKMPLTVVWCTFNRARDEKVLRAIPTLEKINDKPVAEFWKALGREKKRGKNPPGREPWECLIRTQSNRPQENT